MARNISSKTLATRTARRVLQIHPRPYWLFLSGGCSLGYRKNRGARGGAWLAKYKSGPFRKEARIGWADDVFDADNVQVLDFEQAQEHARKWFKDAVRESTGEYVHSGPYHVSQAIADYLQSLKHRGAPDFESATYDLNANAVPRLGSVEVRKLTRPKLEAWRSHVADRPRRKPKKVKDGEKPEQPKPMAEDEQRRRRATANRTARRLIAALNYALETGKVNANPMNWKLPPFENVEVARAAFLTEAAQRDFVSACTEEPDFQTLVLAALHSGARYSELGRLRVSDFANTSKSVFIGQSKGGESRHVFLDEDGVEFFKRLTAKRAQDEVMLLRANGENWEKDDQKKPMARSCKKAKVMGLGFHGLRHSFATRLLMRGVSLKIVAQQLGHRDTRMCERHYGHLIDSHVQEVIAGLPGAGLNEAARNKKGIVVALPRKRA